MWYRHFRHLSDADVAAVIAYLRSLEPVYNPLPRTALPSEEQARLDSQPPLPLKPVDLTSPDLVELGRGLVMLANCAGCHTGWEAPRTPGLLGGGNLLEGEHGRVSSTNLTPHTSGLSYSADAFIALIRSGKGGTVHPFMPWIVFRNLSDADLRAIHAFLQTVYPVAHYVDNHAAPTYCPVCGQEHGLGEMNRLERLEGIALDPATYPRYVGNFYSEEYDFTLAVSVAEGRLVVSDDGDPAVEMIPLSSARFVVPGEVAPLRFVFDANGHAVQVIFEEVEEVVLERADG
jgi:mono/diheme cytochrome c family protein